MKEAGQGLGVFFALLGIAVVYYFDRILSLFESAACR